MRHENDQGSVRKFLGEGQHLSPNERIAASDSERSEAESRNPVAQRDANATGSFDSAALRSG